MTMIEKVARAIADADMDGYEAMPLRYDAMALAALRAMRIEKPEHDEDTWWNAMIDAALSEADRDGDRT